MATKEERWPPSADALSATNNVPVKAQTRPYTQKAIQLTLSTLIACICISVLHFITASAFPDPDNTSTIINTVMTIKQGLVIASALLGVITVGYWNIASQLEGEPLAIAISQILNLIAGALLVLGFLLWKISGRLM